MTEIKTSIEPEDIEWEMDWSGNNPDGTRRYPDKPEKEMRFEQCCGLAMLLINEVVHLNNHWWKKTWPEDARQATYMGVRCNDVFAWGCSDSEELNYKEIKSVYDMWSKDPSWGADIWCIIKRKEMPQRPVEKRIRDAGIWDLDALKLEHNLKNNHYEGISLVLAQRKYDAYCAWERSNGVEPLVFDASWWDGWKRFTDANPDWKNDSWKDEEKKACQAWREENGYGEI